ncbi:MAG: hypothetical protein AAB729_02500 [Patescibacteria group bacterium]
MKKSVIYIIITFVVVAAVLLLLSRNNTAGNSPSQNPVSAYETKTDSQGEVNVTVTPIDLKAGSSQWGFDVGFSTHSVELNEDISQVSVLVDDQGKQYKPVSWQGPGPGGHHREGTLIFNPISPLPKSATLKILGLAGISSRDFNWALQ